MCKFVKLSFSHATGAIYCDVSLRASGFNGEGVRSGAVIAVKTHRPVPLWTEGNVSVINKRVCSVYLCTMHESHTV